MSIALLTIGLPYGTGADDASTLEEAISLVRSELTLIDEGQEAADCYTPAQVLQIRIWLQENDPTHTARGHQIQRQVRRDNRKYNRRSDNADLVQ